MTFLFIPPLFCIIGYKSAQDVRATRIRERECVDTSDSLRAEMDAYAGLHRGRADRVPEAPLLRDGNARPAARTWVAQQLRDWSCLADIEERTTETTLNAQAMLLFLAGGKTEPIQTLLFMQASIPLSALMSSMVYGTRSVACCSLLLSAPVDTVAIRNKSALSVAVVLGCARQIHARPSSGDLGDQRRDPDLAAPRV